MATTKDENVEPREIVGMTLPGIEDYTNDFSDDSESDSEIKNLNVMHNKSIIRQSFQALLPLTATNNSSKLPLSLPLTSKSLPAAMLDYNFSQSDDTNPSVHDDLHSHPHRNHDDNGQYERGQIIEEEEEEDPQLQQNKSKNKTEPPPEERRQNEDGKGIQDDHERQHEENITDQEQLRQKEITSVIINDALDTPSEHKLNAAKTKVIDKGYDNELELDEGSSSSDRDEDDDDSSDDEEDDDDSDTTTDGSSSGTSDDDEDSSDDDDDDDDDDEEDDSSSWGTEDDDIDEGAMTYLSVLTQQQNPNATQFTLTPFDSVVDDATKSLKIKYDKITYPTGSKFFSEDLLKTEDYHRLQNIQLVKWIKSDNDYNDDEEEKEKKEKEKEMVDEIVGVPSNDNHEDEDKVQKQQQHHYQMENVALSDAIYDIDDIGKWLKCGIDKIYSYYRGLDNDALLRGLNLMEESIFDPFEHYLSLSVEQQDDYQLFKLFEYLLHLYARLVCKLPHKTNKVTNQFERRLKMIKRLFPKYEQHLELLKETYKAHDDSSNANHCIQSFVRIYYENQGQRKTNKDNEHMFELSVKALVALDLYMENYSPLNHSILSDQAAYDIESEAFKWLDTVYNNNNLRRRRRRRRAQSNGDDDDEDDDDDDDDEDESESEESESDEESEDDEESKYDDHDHMIIDDKLYQLKLELCSNPQSRINRLVLQYRQFTGFSFLRARVSWVIGHSKLYHERNFYISEKYFFESLYCLKKLTKYEYFPLNSTMYTELASLVLIDYADVLLENKKYPYAIIALEKVINCLQQRQKYERRFQIIRKLCITCTEKEDWNRAIKYHNITLRKLKDDYLNLNEFVYLSQQISTIHLKLNNFNQSEKELQNGIKTIYLNVLSYHRQQQKHHLLENNNNINNMQIGQIFEICEGEERVSIGSLILVLANLYISGGNYLEQAINLLRYLRKHIFTNKASTRRILILFQLSRAYFKHGRYIVANNIIEKEILPRYSTKNNKLLSSLEFIQLRVLIMINCKRFKEAIKLLDDTMNHRIRKESFVKRAKINYLKGRVLQTRCFDFLIKEYQKEQQRMKTKQKRESSRQYAKIIITRPDLNQADQVQDDEDDDDDDDDEKIPIPISAQQHTSKHRRGGNGGVGNFMYNNTRNADTINPLDAQSTYLLSHSDFRRIQDPIMQAKCCLELGRTYLEILMEYYALPKFVLRETKCSEPILKWLANKIFNDYTTPNQEVITHCLDEINRPLYNALNLCVSETKDIGLLIESYIALAEFEFLKSVQNDMKDKVNVNSQLFESSNQTSKNFWKQSKITFFSCYKDSDDWIFLRRIDRHSRLQLFGLFKRIIRLLICYDNKFIADNVDIFVSYLSLETFMVAQKDINIKHHDDNNHHRTNDKDGHDTNHRNGLNKDEHNKQSFDNNQASQQHHLPSLNGRSSKYSKSRQRGHHYQSSTVDFGRLNSAAIYNSSINNAHQENPQENMEEEKRKKNITKNPTITFRIKEEESDGLSKIQLAADYTATRPLYQRYRNYNSESEKYLDELFRMHWKMRTESNMFSGGRLTEIDNDKSMVQITKCIAALNGELDINSSLNRKHRSWSANETFVISLDSIVFVFHPHTLLKYAITKNKRNDIPKYDDLKSFANVLYNIAFHDSDFLKLADNPWINRENATFSFINNDVRNININLSKIVIMEEKEEEKEEKPKRRRFGAAARKKKPGSLTEEKQLLLKNQLSLPFMKIQSIKELLMCLDPQNILNVLGAIFSESQIIIVSKERCRALAIIDALFVLMYPFSWQYPCIPWLSPHCFQLLNLPIPYIFGIANIETFNDIIRENKFDVCNKNVIIDVDTNNLMKPSSSSSSDFHELPLKIKSKLTRAMFRLMSGLLKNAFQANTQKHWVFPPRRRDNIQTNNNSKYILSNNSASKSYAASSKYNLLSSPHTGPISICSERKSWYKQQRQDDDEDDKLKQMIINFQKEFCTAWVEVLEQHLYFHKELHAAMDKDIRSQEMANIQKYAHPRYRKFLSKIQKTRMFSSFQCIRSLAKLKMLATTPIFDNLCKRSLKWRQSLYHDILTQTLPEEARMKVSVENCKKRHFIDHVCLVKFAPKLCKLRIEPHRNFVTHSDPNLIPFEVTLKATNYELESDDVNKLHPYIDPKQVQKYGERYQFKIKHQEEGTYTLNCKNYYELTRWIHMIRTHSMDTWSWNLNRLT